MATRRRTGRALRRAARDARRVRFAAYAQHGLDREAVPVQHDPVLAQAGERGERASEHQRVNCHDATVPTGQPEQVVAATVDRGQQRKRTATGTTLCKHRHAVGQLIADQGLRAVDQIRHQQVVPFDAGWHRSARLVHHLEQCLVRKYV